jgi:hypothetical protein
MKWYELVKIIHFMGLISLTGAFIIHLRAGTRLRAAGTMHDVRTWLGLLEIARGMLNGGATMMGLSGLLMFWMRWRTGGAPRAFITLGILALITISMLFALIVGRHLKAMNAAAGDGIAGDAPVPADLSRTILQPRPWIVMLSINVMAVTVLFEMTLKLDYIGAIALLAAGAAIGAFAGAAMLRKERSA